VLNIKIFRRRFLKEGVDERSNHGALRQNNQNSQQQHDDNHRQQPPPLVVHEKRKQLPDYTEPAFRDTDETHTSSLTLEDLPKVDRHGAKKQRQIFIEQLNVYTMTCHFAQTPRRAPSAWQAHSREAKAARTPASPAPELNDLLAR
jgi:hypothetical protein